MQTRLRGSVHVPALLLAALCVGGYLLVGTAAVVAVVLAGTGLLAWRVAAASRPRPPGRT